MKKKRFVLRKRLCFYLSLVFIFIPLSGAVFFLHAGSFLIAKDSFTHADMGLVLSGYPLSRCLAASELYQAGKINEILIIPEPINPLREKLIELGMAQRQSDPLEETKHILTTLRVPPSKITFLPGSADGTVSEACLVHRFFKSRNTFPKQMVIITSRPASRRARFIFHQIFKKEPVQILSYPTPYDSFQPDRWWSQPRNALSVVEEYQKFLVNAVMLLCGAGKEAS